MTRRGIAGLVLSPRAPESACSALLSLLPCHCLRVCDAPLVADDLVGLLDKCTEEEVLSVASFIADEGMHKLGYDMLLLDDCWSATERNASGHPQPNAKQFPSGMKYLVDRVHELGLRIVRCRHRRACGVAVVLYPH